MQKTPNKALIIGAIIAIVAIALVSVAPVAYKAYMTPGVKTNGIATENAKKASTDINGQWHVIKAVPGNPTSVGYTFHEILPGERRETSGSTKNVEGTINVQNTKLTGANISVDMTAITTDREKRDINVRSKLLHTDKFPTATFTLADGANVDLAELPDNATTGRVSVPGILTIHGVAKPATADMEILRTGDQIVAAATIPINRLDYGVETPEFVAAKIDTEGEINIRLALEK
ncbi:YceI family protein [Corynebacterium epidermidicanis]|uniref:Lipid/polyisoprenoid-binding YceI-like domain-containing protein n=1 Tax=Corynebacterium epidermidicanis TaxID=1050174 RepID=A0A0G3GRD2_9CORY|nr:YceI family protein [Corynebacterium epidermidicanis]AKK03110.1 hypothetical protein CEPID_06250 [Corynebacterium epidermidicanis]